MTLGRDNGSFLEVVASKTNKKRQSAVTMSTLLVNQKEYN